MSAAGQVYEALLALRRFFAIAADPRTAVRLAEWERQTTDHALIDAVHRDWANACLMTHNALQKGVSYLWVSAEMQNLLEAASVTFPADTPLVLEKLPWPSALCVFERPMTLRCSLLTDRAARAARAAGWRERDRENVTVQAFGWGRSHFVDRPNGLACGWYTNRPTWNIPDDSRILRPAITTAWPVGESVAGGHDGAEQIRIHKLMACLWSMVQQRIALVGSGAGTRSERRRYERAVKDASELPAVVIVRLRRPVSSRPDNEQEVGFVDWSHRWIVDGHWRNQYRPSSGEHVPTWIAPYVKGPDNKPLVLKESINAWVR